MKEQSGRSLIEIVGVLAIGVIMIAAAYNMYKSIDQRQKRLIAYEEIADVAKKTKILYEFSGYRDATIENLVAKGAISNKRSPIGTDWRISSGATDDEFVINIRGLSHGECSYFVLKKSDWAYKVTPTECAKNDNNEVTFFVK